MTTNRADHLNRLRQLPQGEALTESPIELALHRTLLKYLNVRPYGGGTGNSLLIPQVNLSTQGGTFRADFLLVAGEHITLIECDGAAFHADPFDDHLRSAFILHAGLADQVIRFNGSMLHHSPADAALWIAASTPEAFWPGALDTLKRIATPEGVTALTDYAADLKAGSMNAHYVCRVEDTDDRHDEFEDDRFPVDFFCMFDRATATAGRVSEFLALLNTVPAGSPQELEKIYWAVEREKGEARSKNLFDSIQRRADAESGPATPALFDEQWAILLDRFQGQKPKAPAEAYRAALSRLPYAAQVERAFMHVFVNAKFFPTPEELASGAATNPLRDTARRNRERW